MYRIAKTVAALLFLLFVPATSAVADNPFPGVAYGAEIPGLSKTITCTDTPQIPDDCIRQGGGQVTCPADAANDITPTLRLDGSWAAVKSWCRNSWSPPTTAADEEDFRNRQELAIAAATLESQAFSASHPGEQKCVTWGPIVHANGISTSSGGVCANVVGTKPDGTTAQVAPSHVGSEPSGQPQTNASATGSESQTSSSTPALSGAQTLIPYIDLTQYGFGRPFTQVVSGNLSASQCPAGYQAATNGINTGFSEAPATECWPANAWTAYSIGGDVWTQFKASNGSLNAEAEASRRIQVNAIRALALQQAQQFANQTIGLKRCASWSGFGESGQECAYIPVQNNTIGGVITSSSGDTSTTQIKTGTEVVVAKISSAPGQLQVDWEKSDSYTAFICPSGSGRALSLDLNGTLSKSDDIWTLSCIEVVLDATTSSETSTVSIPIAQDSATSTLNTPVQAIVLSSADTATAISADTIDFKGTVNQIIAVAQNLLLSKSESLAIASTLSKLANLKQPNSLIKVALPNSPVLTEIARSLTPSICKVSGLVIQPKKAGTCQISYTIEGMSGNSFEATKKLTFKK